MRKVIANVFEKFNNILHSDSFKETYRMHDKDFTRNRKLGFGDLCLMILRGSKNGVQAGINEFLHYVKSDVESYSNAAFCKARQKINPDAFKYLVDVEVEEYYGKENIKLYNGYRIFAIDGTDFNLPNSESLLEEFGSEKFSAGYQVQAQVSCMYDVLNNIIVDSIIAPFNTSERDLAQEHVKNFALHKPGKDIVTMDRGYPSEDILSTLENQGYKYVLRTNKKEFFREIRDVKKPDEIVERKCKNRETLRFRVVTVQLENGTEETLLTNLFDENMNAKDLGDIYRLRWGIETAYDRLKNQFRIEDFTGITPTCIKQDFYATIFLANLLSFIEDECEEDVNIINSNEILKYQYKINSALAICTLKRNVVELFMSSSKRAFMNKAKIIHNELLHCLTPERPGRCFVRKNMHPSIRFHQNNKLS